MEQGSKMSYVKKRVTVIFHKCSSRCVHILCQKYKYFNFVYYVIRELIHTYPELFLFPFHTIGNEK